MENEVRIEYNGALQEFQLRRAEVLNAFQPLREHAANIAQIAGAAYAEGGVDLLRLLDAERARLDADLAWARGMADYWQSVARLEAAEGVDNESEFSDRLYCWRACCNRRAATQRSDRDGRRPKEAKANKDEIVLPPDQQAAAKIETQTAALSSEPDMLRVKGPHRIGRQPHLAGRRPNQGSVMRVYAGLGDHVTKGQILARYHADEVRDSRAKYRAAGSERDRAKAATAQAQRNLDRAKRLLELKAGSVQQVEQAQQDLVSAQAADRKAEIEVDRRAIFWKTI